MANKTGKRTFGHVRQRKQGWWQASYVADGQRIFADEQFATKGAAESWLAEIQTERSRGNWVDPRLGRQEFRGYAEEWIEGRSLAPRTESGYRRLLRLHLAPTFGDVQLKLMDPISIRRWHKELSATHPSTAAKAYRLLRTVLATAVEDRVLPVSPCDIKGGGTEDPDERPTATPEQVAILATSIVPRLRVMVLLGAYASLRYGEALGLRRSDVDTVAGTVSVRGAIIELDSGDRIYGPPKTRASRRTVAIPPWIRDQLREHLDTYVGTQPDAYLFVGPSGSILRRSNFRKLWLATKRRADRKGAHVPDDFHFHDLRHTGNTLAAQAGATIRDLMARGGWTSPSMVVRYMHTDSDRDRLLADSLDALVRSANEMTALQRSNVVPLRDLSAG
jgi:integrase